MRPISFTTDYQANAYASCVVAYGRTRVLCSASLERSVPPFRRGSGGGWLTAEYAMLPGSTPGGRKQREFSKRDGRSVEIQRLVGRALRAAVDIDAFGEVTLAIDCDVLDADGGTRTAAISGGWVALALALRRLAAESPTPAAKPALIGQVAAVSVGVVDGEIICDLDYHHDSRAEVDMNVVMRDGSLVEVQGTGEKGVFDRAQLGRLLDVAEVGIAEIMAAQRLALG